MSGIFDQVINYAPPSLLKGTVTYKGTWSAATNTPTLPNPPSSVTNGHYYVVSAGGTQFSLVFNIGDWIISNGSAWEKVDNTDAVDSVFGRTGAVVGVSTDYSSVGITATAVGASSPSTGAFTTLSATTPLAVASGGTGVASSTGTTNVVLSGSPTITTPVIAQINDANGNETLKLASIASAVNEVTIENAATGNAVHISATGGDASVGLHLAGKGTSGYVNVQDSTDATKRIMFNAAGGTTNTRTMLSSTQTVDRILSLPDATDMLVGRATTDTLTNKTLTSPTITGGALNGTLGATTPSSVAATTGTFSSTLGVTGVATLGNGAILGTPASGTVTNLTGTASININGTVGATTPSTVAATTISASSTGLVTGTFGVGAAPVSEKMRVQTAVGKNLVVDSATQAAAGVRISSVNDADSANALLEIQSSHTRLVSGVQVTNSSTSTTGAGLELLWDGTNSTAQSFDRAGAAWKGLILGGLTTTIQASGSTIATISSTGAAITGTLSATGNVSGTGASFTADDSASFGPGGASTGHGIINILSGSASGGGGGFRFKKNGTNKWFVGDESWVNGNSSDGFGFWLGSGTQVMSLSSTGNVGIGTASPNQKLHITGSSLSQAIALENTGSGGKRYDLISSSSGSGYGSGSFVIEDQAVGARLMINSSGDVLIGTTSTLNSNIGLSVQASQGSGGAAVITGYNSASSAADNSPVLVLMKAMTTTTSSARFVQFYADGTTTPMGAIVGNGASNVQFAAISDAREKTNVQALEGSLAKIFALKPVAFDWIKSGEHINSGFIAQDVEKVFPEFVVSNMFNEGEEQRYGLTGGLTSGIIPHIVAALQELKLDNDSLRKRLAALESK